MFRSPLLLTASFLILLSLKPAYADGPQGIDSDGTDLPINANHTPAALVGGGSAVPAGDVEFLNQVGIGTATPQDDLDVKGNIKMGDGGALCSPTNLGAMRFNQSSTTFQGCSNGSNWSPLSTVGIASGIITSGNQIPIPTGYSRNQCQYMVSLNYRNDGEGTGYSDNLAASVDITGGPYTIGCPIPGCVNIIGPGGEAPGTVHVGHSDYDQWHWEDVANYMVICQ